MISNDSHTDAASFPVAQRTKFLAVSAFCLLFSTAMIGLAHFIPGPTGQHLGSFTFFGMSLIGLAAMNLGRDCSLLSKDYAIAFLVTLTFSFAYMRAQVWVNTPASMPEGITYQPVPFFISLAVVLAVAKLCAIVVRGKIWAGFSLS